MDEQTGEIKSADHMVSFAWSLDWALCQVKKPGECVTSPPFSTLMPDLTVQQWKLQLYPEGASRRSRGHLSLQLRTAESKKRVHLWKVVTFHLKGNDDEELYRIYGLPEAKPKPPVVVCRDRYVAKQAIEKRSAELLSYGKLTVVCTVMELCTDLKYGFANRLYADQDSPTPVQRSRSLADLTDSKYDDEEEEEEAEAEVEPPGDKFEALLASGRSDVTIGAAGDRSFHAHRAILAARSSFFRGLFEQDEAQRKRSSFVDMSDLGAEVVVELLRYVYLDRVEGLAERAGTLLGPANKYGLEKLKAVCEAVMVKGLSVDNASEYLVLSFQHEADRLQEKAMDFVVGHSLDVFNTPGFKAIAGSHANVIAALLKTVVIKGKEEQAQEQPQKIENKDPAVEDKKEALPVRTENKKVVVESKEEQVQEREQPSRMENKGVLRPKPSLRTGVCIPRGD